MFQLSENYRLRKCYFKNNEVPTQSVMRNIMSPALAEVYFKSMSPKLKVLAGLEPPLKGGGADWIIPPGEILKEGRVVLKPFKKKYMAKWNCYGVDEFGMTLVEKHREQMKDERETTMHESDLNWKTRVERACRQERQDCALEQTESNTEYLKLAFSQFADLYTTSITKFQNLLFDAAVTKIKSTREEAFQKMQTRYENFLKQQATMLYDRYTKKLDDTKAHLKNEFIQNLEERRNKLEENLHDLNVEKHLAIEKSRKYLECKNLACQVYIALREREECKKEIELAEHRHAGTMMTLTEILQLQQFEIKLAEQKERKRKEFNRIWQKKVCHVVKNFQTFVSYCLNMLPDHAEFFINMEKLMLLQLNEALENPTSESIYIKKADSFHTPVPHPHPFFLFCDRSYIAQATKVDQDLCPKHCTSSASQLPAIIINKRCIYAACDNFEQFTDKVRGYIAGRRGDDTDIQDNREYSFDVPVKYTESQQLKELKLESSLLQVLQQEIENLKQLPIECRGCKMTHCFCNTSETSFTEPMLKKKTEILEIPVPVTEPPDIPISRGTELQHGREPKWDSYSQFIKSKKCDCAKTAKKDLLANLPPYMRNMSHYDAPEMPNYEICPATTLKALAKKARGRQERIPPPPKVESKTREISTQYSDQNFDYLCTCFSDEDIEQFLKNLTFGKVIHPPPIEHLCDVVGLSWSRTYLNQKRESFVRDRTASLRKLMEPEVLEIFKNKDCSFGE